MAISLSKNKDMLQGRDDKKAIRDDYKDGN